MMLLDNETICISDLEPSNVKLYELTSLETVGTVFAIGKLAIYLWLLYHLRLHDDKTHQEGVIT